MFQNLSLAQHLEVILLLIANISIQWYYLWNLPKWCFWTLPSTVIGVVYFLNYPIRAAYIVYIGDRVDDILHMAYNVEDLAQALAYATIYYGLFVITTVFLIKKYLKLPSVELMQEEDAKRGFARFANVLCIAVLLAAAIRYRSLQIQGIVGGEMAGAFGDTLLDNIMYLQWVAMFAAAVMIWRFRMKRFALHFGLVVAVLLLRSFVLTEKASIFIFAILYLVCESFLKINSRKTVFIAIMCLGLGNSMYSYMIRSYGNFRGTINKDTVAGNLGTTMDNREELWQMGPYLINRFNLMDNLIYTMKRSEQMDKGVYKFGTVVEIANFIPRVIWPERPFLYFNYFVVEQIFGLPFGSSDSIGRIGESYFVASYAGVFAGIGYAWLFFFLFYRLWHLATRVYKRLIFINIFGIYIIHDAYLFQAAVPLVFTGLIIWIVSLPGPRERLNALGVKTRILSLNQRAIM